MKGIIYAGTECDGLYPIINKVINKYMLPIYDKPMIYYSISTLVSCGISEICIVSCPEYLNAFKEIFNDGSNFGLKIEYRVQYQDKGMLECFLICEDFIKDDIVGLICADNIFHGMNHIRINLEGAIIFGYNLKNGENKNYFVFDENKKVKEILTNDNKNELSFKNTYFIPDLYFFDKNVNDIVKSVIDLNKNNQIIELLNHYLSNNILKCIPFPKGNIWVDCKTIQDIYNTSCYIQAIQNRQGNYVGCIEEQCLFQNYINNEKLNEIISNMKDSKYKDYLKTL